MAALGSSDAARRVGQLRVLGGAAGEGGQEQERQERGAVGVAELAGQVEQADQVRDRDPAAIEVVSRLHVVMLDDEKYELLDASWSTTLSRSSAKIPMFASPPSTRSWGPANRSRSPTRP